MGPPPAVTWYVRMITETAWRWLTGNTKWGLIIHNINIKQPGQINMIFSSISHWRILSARTTSQKNSGKPFPTM